MLRESTSTQGDGDYTTAQDTSSAVTDTSYSVIKQNTDFTVQQGRKFACKQIEKYRERRSAEQAETTRAHAAGERGVSPKQVRYGTLPDADQRPRRGADLPRQRAKEKVVTAKTAPRDIRGVTQGQRRIRTAANQTVHSVTTQVQMQTYAQKYGLPRKGCGRHRQNGCGGALGNSELSCRLAQPNSGSCGGRKLCPKHSHYNQPCSVCFRLGLRHLFAANAPNAASVTVREAVETLTAEYRDRLEEISETVQHDRQDITAIDDVYYIRWQDVLAVFSSYVAGSEQGAPVAALTENQVDKLREIMWAMNAVDYSTRAETAVIETTDKTEKQPQQR